MTSDKIFICEQQQEFFEDISKNKVDMYTFIPAFLMSDFCNRELDAFYSVYQYSDLGDWEDFLKKEIEITPDLFTKKRISVKISGWLGYTYRYIQIESGLKSRDIIEKIPVEKLILSYEGLHTVDEKMAYKIICHDFIQ